MSESAEYRSFVESNWRILVVDDNKAIHDDYKKTLGGRESSHHELDELEAEMFGEEVADGPGAFELDSAFQGQDGIDMVRRSVKEGRSYALAFVDVRMPPGMDGIQATARMLEEDPSLNVVICSAYSDHSWEDMAAAIGETDRVLILKKPFDTIEVRQLAHALRRRWELSRLASIKVADLNSVIEERTVELQQANAMLQKEAAAREEVMRQLADSNEQVRALAYQDGLTGLPNRRLLNEHLEKVLARSHRKGTEFALLFLDLDNFKLINDTIGHQGADEVLRYLADALSDLIRGEDVLALYISDDFDPNATITAAPLTDSVLSRLGGDEFVILLPEIRDRLAAGAVAHRILERLEKPYVIDGNEVCFSASIGIATYPADGETAELLLRNADTAMYYAKELGKAAYQYYSAEMNAASVERMTLEAGLRHAVHENDLELHYQPEIDVQTGQLIGAEALLRWQDPIRGYIPPSTFIPIAEDCGLILSIGEWVIEEACRQAAEWQRKGLGEIPVSVNVSGLQFRRQDICRIVRRCLEKHSLEPERLCLEITETSLISAQERATNILKELRNLGVRVALDDFGTGYSSLSYLKDFPLDQIKIDRSFIAEMLDDETTASVTKAIIVMARVVGMKVLAEGVENERQLEVLRQLDCDAVQGYLFSPAVSASEFEQLARARFPVGGPVEALPGAAGSERRRRVTPGSSAG